MEDSLTITFPQPIEHGGVTYASVSLREPTAGELVQTDGLDGFAKDVRIISAVGAMPEAAVRLMPARPFLQATGYIGSFMRPAPATGADA